MFAKNSLTLGVALENGVWKVNGISYFLISYFLLSGLGVGEKNAKLREMNVRTSEYLIILARDDVLNLMRLIACLKWRVNWMCDNEHSTFYVISDLIGKVVIKPDNIKARIMHIYVLYAKGESLIIHYREGCCENLDFSIFIIITLQYI